MVGCMEENSVYVFMMCRHKLYFWKTKFLKWERRAHVWKVIRGFHLFIYKFVEHLFAWHRDQS